jgi:hypothetical protein
MTLSYKSEGEGWPGWVMPRKLSPLHVRLVCCLLVYLDVVETPPLECDYKLCAQRFSTYWRSLQDVPKHHTKYLVSRLKIRVLVLLLLTFSLLHDLRWVLIIAIPRIAIPRTMKDLAAAHRTNCVIWKQTKLGTIMTKHAICLLPRPPRDYTPRVFHNRKRKLTLPSSLPTTTNLPLPSTLPTATNVAKTDHVITIIIIAIVSLCVLAFLHLPHFTCTCTLSI